MPDFTPVFWLALVGLGAIVGVVLFGPYIVVALIWSQMTALSVTIGWWTALFAFGMWIWWLESADRRIGKKGKK